MKFSLETFSALNVKTVGSSSKTLHMISSLELLFHLVCSAKIAVFFLCPQLTEVLVNSNRVLCPTKVLRLPEIGAAQLNDVLAAAIFVIVEKNKQFS